MIDAAEYYYARQILKGEEIVEKTFTFPNDNELKYNGEKPKTGEIKLDYKGRIKIALYDGKYCASKDYDESTITLTEITLQECVPQPYKDVVLNGSDPILDPGMIPVTIEDNGTVKKADLFKEWYNYNDKKWANAVLVSSDVRDSYNKGDIIPENKILAYFVWIPRYEYETINSETPKEIKINFISKQTVTPSTKYIIHPAFTFDNKELSGFWIGKI